MTISNRIINNVKTFFQRTYSFFYKSSLNKGEISNISFVHSKEDPPENSSVDNAKEKKNNPLPLFTVKFTMPNLENFKVPLRQVERYETALS